MSMKARYQTATVVLLFAAAGCGGQSEQEKVTGTVEGYFSALAGGEYEDACSKLAASARRDAAEYAASTLPEVGTLKCDEIFEQVFSLADESDLERLNDVSVEKVEITGDRATVTVRNAPQQAKLAKIGGEWKISELNFPAPQESAAEPEAEPETVPEPEAESGANGEVERVKNRLEAAGYKPEVGEPGGNEPVPEGEIEVPLKKGQVTIYLYVTAADAQSTLKDFDAVERESPDQVDARAKGSWLYVGTIEEPATFPSAELDAVIAAAEG
jgi:hypothetical protein